MTIHQIRKNIVAPAPLPETITQKLLAQNAYVMASSGTRLQTEAVDLLISAGRMEEAERLLHLVREISNMVNHRD